MNKNISIRLAKQVQSTGNVAPCCVWKFSTRRSSHSWGLSPSAGRGWPASPGSPARTAARAPSSRRRVVLAPERFCSSGSRALPCGAPFPLRAAAARPPSVSPGSSGSPSTSGSSTGTAAWLWAARVRPGPPVPPAPVNQTLQKNQNDLPCVHVSYQSLVHFWTVLFNGVMVSSPVGTAAVTGSTPGLSGSGSVSSSSVLFFISPSWYFPSPLAIRFFSASSSRTSCSRSSFWA